MSLNNDMLTEGDGKEARERDQRIEAPVEVLVCVKNRAILQE